ncbi:MAG: hypothetical protein JWN70_4723, partial [Planctomycetaceae bacterium]|nr:hypothetical protein [Planctomycetaceae bacterium]
TSVVTVTATDADLPAQSVTFSLTGGVDQSKFTITSGGVLSFLTAPNREIPTDANTDNVYLVQVTANDGAGGTTVQNLSVTVTGVNDNNPVFSSTATPSIPENTTGVLTVIATDADLPAQTVTFSLTGGADQSKFAITTGGVLTFQAAPNFESPSDANADNVYLIQVTANDGAGGTTVQNLSVTVTGVNDNIPVFTSTATPSVQENTTSVLTVMANDADLPAQSVAFSLTGGVDQSKFTITAGGVLSFLTAPNREIPTDANGDNVYLVQVTASDGAGGTTVQNLAVTVTGVNDNNPVFTSTATPSVAENTTAVLTVIATDADLPAQTLTYSLTGGADQSKFAITAGGVLTFQAAPNFESPSDANGDNVYLVQVTASDGVGGATVQNLSVTVTAVNDNNPVFSSTASLSIVENTTAVLTVNATDADLPAQNITYSLTGGADQSKFAITTGGVLTFQTAPNFESPTDANANNVYLVQVTANDGAGRTTVQNLSVTVTGVNDNNPVFTSTATPSVSENTTNVLTVTTTDADVPQQTITYLLTGGADQSQFALTTGGGLTFLTAPDFEIPTDANGDNVYLVQVTADDGAGGTTVQNLAVTVTAVNDNHPVFSTTATPSVPENTTSVLTVAATDADLPAQAVTFSLTGGADQSQFAITTGGVLAFLAAPDFEAAADADADNIYLVQVTANDGAGGTTVQNLAVTITGVNDNNPVFTTTANPDISEHTVDVMTFAAIDADLPAQTITFSLTGGDDQAQFAISAEGVLTFLTAPDFEIPADANGDNVYLIDVTADDGAGGTTVQSLAVTVTGVNDNTPVFSTMATPSTPENTTGVLTLAATDADLPTTTITFSITGGADQSRFAITAGGTLTFLTAPDFENPSDADANNVYLVQVTADDGAGGTMTQDLAVAVTGVNESPTISTITDQSILEDTPTGSVPFIVGDPETSAGALIVTAVSSNPALIPNTNIALGGSGANRSLVVTPAANQSGSATITVTVSDGALSSSQTFAVTAHAVDDAPLITLSSSPLVFHVNARKVVAIDGAATIADVDTPTLAFAGSILQVSGHSAKDAVSILKQSGIGLKGKNVLFGGTVIGTVAGGKKGAALVVHLTSFATEAAVQTLLRSIVFKSTDKVAGNRTIKFQVTNIGGSNTNIATRQIQVGP